MADALGVAQIVHSLEIGGMERVATYLATRIDRLRFRPMVVCLTVRGEYADEAEAAGVPVVALGKQPGIDLRLPGRLAALFRDRGIRVAHAHNSGPWFSAGVAVRLAKTPGFVVTDHSRAYPEKWRRRVVERLLARGGRVVSVSEDNKKQLSDNIGIPAERIEVIPNGVLPAVRPSEAALARLREAVGLRDGEILVLNVARLEEQKSHSVLVDAAAILRDRGCPIRVAIVGFGRCEAALREQIRIRRLVDKVVLAGKRLDAVDFYFIADLFALSSRWEGLPMTVLEAMGAGLPVVSTDVGDVARAVEEGSNGRLCPPDSPAALADALEPLVRSRDLRSAMGARSRAIFDERFHVDRMVERYERIYEAYR